MLDMGTRPLDFDVPSIQTKHFFFCLTEVPEEGYGGFTKKYDDHPQQISYVYHYHFNAFYFESEP